MKILTKLIFLLLILAYLQGCAPYLMKAKMASRDKRYELALDYGLHHLKNNPQDRTAQELVEKVARKYYESQQAEISRIERLENWERMIAESEETFNKLHQLSNYAGIRFPTKTELDFLKSKMAFSNRKQAETLYLDAVEAFKQGTFERALSLFQEIEEYAPNYKDSGQYILRTKENLAEKKYQEGLLVYNNKQYESAIEKFNAALELVPNYKDAVQYLDRANKSLAFDAYQKAQTLQKEGKYKEALAQFQASQQYVPGFEDVDVQIHRTTNQLVQSLSSQAESMEENGDLQQAYKTYEEVLHYQPENPDAQEKYNTLKEKLTVRLGVLPFQVQRLDYQFGAIAAEEISASLAPKKSDFLELVDRDHLKQILEEQALAQTGIYDENKAVEVGKLVGVNHIMAGQVTLVSSKYAPAIRTRKTGHYKQNYLDSRGVKRTKEIPFNYTHYKSVRTVVVQVSYRLIDVATSKIIDQQSFTKTETDEAAWVVCDKDRVKDLPKSDRNLISGNKVTKSENALINNAINNLVKPAAEKVWLKAKAFRD